MIRPNDFEIRLDTHSTGTNVRVRHIPTGNERTRLAESDKVRHVRDELLAELWAILFAENDVRVDIGRSTGGDFICVTHIPSGIQRTAMRRERSEMDLLDEVLEELHADPFRRGRIQETVHQAE